MNNGRKNSSAAKRRGAADDGARTVTLQIRLSEEERAVMDEAAATRHIPTGTWIRAVVLDEVARIRADAKGRK